MKPLGGGGITTATGTVMDNGIGNAGRSVGWESWTMPTLFVLHGMREHHEAAKWPSSVMPLGYAKPKVGGQRQMCSCGVRLLEICTILAKRTLLKESGILEAILKLKVQTSAPV
ncbi:hypothetical protein HD554DRAFT_2034841 [Boletus coccyginus]|nr:hypothetical protein HD554DRAFT_2034841 [Boletus coccyginus]